MNMQYAQAVLAHEKAQLESWSVKHLTANTQSTAPAASHYRPAWAMR